MTKFTRPGAHAALALVVLLGSVACSDGDEGTTPPTGGGDTERTTTGVDEPITTSVDEREGDSAPDPAGGDVALSRRCSDAVGELQGLVDELADVGSLDVGRIREVLRDRGDRMEGTPRQLDDVKVEGDAKEATLDALRSGLAAARRAADEAANQNLGAARDEVDRMFDDLSAAREHAAEADVDCSVRGP